MVARLRRKTKKRKKRRRPGERDVGALEIKSSPFPFVPLQRFFWPDSHPGLSNTTKCAFRAVENDAARSTRARNRGVKSPLSPPFLFNHERFFFSVSSNQAFFFSFLSLSLSILTWPFSSPTTTTALNESCFPPVQTLVTRETWTTRSWNSGASADAPSRRPRPPPAARRRGSR